MGKKDKAVDAIVKEDAEVMTTQDEGVIPNAEEKKDEVIVEKETEVITEQDVGSVDGIMESTTEDEDVGKEIDPNKVETKDEEINKIGTDVPTVERPDPRKAEVPEDGEPIDPVMYKLNQLEWQNVQLRGAMVYLVKSLMTPADIEDFKTLFPGLL